MSFGQIISALGLLAGVRLLTEYVPPGIYGQVVLLSGAAALCLGVACTPYTQGILRFFPDAVLQGAEKTFRHVVWMQLRKRVWLSIGVILLGGAFYALLTGASFYPVLIVCGLLLVDVARSVEMAYLNVQRKQKRYAIWSIAEAWGRPLLAVAAVALLGPEPVAVLLGYLLASVVNLLMIREGRPVVSQTAAVDDVAISKALRDALNRYSRPLLPVGIVGWLGMTSDRYLVAGLIGIHEAGIYSALSGLLSRPFLVLQGVVETTLRPLYFAAVSERDIARERRIFRLWLLVNLGATLVLFFICIIFQRLIVHYFVGNAYESGISLVPYLAAAFLMLSIGYSLNAHLYAHGNTRAILIVSCFALVISLLLMLAFAGRWGVMGIAAAAFVGNLCQVAILWAIVHRADRSHLMT